MKRFVIIDGNSLLFRAFFAMREMVTRDGIYTQGVFAFINILPRNGKNNYRFLRFYLVLTIHENFLQCLFSLKIQRFYV